MNRFYLFSICFAFIFSNTACNNKSKSVTDNSNIIVVNDSVKTNISRFSIDTADIPKEIDIQGIADSVIHWTDKSGEYIAVRTKTLPYQTVDSVNNILLNNVDLYVYCFKFNPTNQKYERIWHIHDFVKDCEFDLLADFFNDVFEITDLNNNEIPEIWTMYRTACRSDVSPCEMKIIIYEGVNKFAMRGTQLIQLSKTEKYGGEFVLDKALTNADSLIIEHAKSLWNMHLKEQFDTN
ncbi:MAG: hypothetical protein IT245_03665 [Bacteroidia bacterium]|nr:hypothetical protein [Bacteroidia bacterium]